MSKIWISDEDEKDMLIPERRLWAKVVGSAIEDIKKEVDMEEFKKLSALAAGQKRVSHRYWHIVDLIDLRDDAWRFLRSSDLDTICNLFLNIHADTIRRGLGIA